MFKGGSTKGTHKDMKAYTIQNLRKNLISEYGKSKTFVDIYIDSAKGIYLGNLKINPKTKETYWFSEGDVDKGYCVKSSTGAVRKGVCKKKSTKRK